MGKTIAGMKVRWRRHCNDARRQSGFAPHSAIRKYGQENFTVTELENFDSEEAALASERSTGMHLRCKACQKEYMRNWAAKQKQGNYV